MQKAVAFSMAGGSPPSEVFGIALWKPFALGDRERSADRDERI
jgi:hypothetical protein